MEQNLWAPWRMAYIRSLEHEAAGARAGTPAGDGGNFLLAAWKRPELDAANLVVHRDANGLVEACMQPQGLNVGVNQARAAGAGLPEHVHAHVLPRWNGDTNFMATVAGARVIPEALESVAEAYRRAVPDALRSVAADPDRG